MQQGILNQVVLPIALFVIMLGMGLSLIPDDFKRVLRAPKAVAIGIICQMLVLPAVGYGVIHLVKFDSPELALGLMILAFCPGGTTSNMFTFLSRGDVALSITLTAVVSVVTPFTIPLLTAATVSALGVEASAFQMPVGKTIVVLLVITALPVAIGMLIRNKKPELADRSERPVKIFSVVFLFAIIAALIKKNAAELPDFFARVGVGTLVLNVTTMALGFGIARLAKLTNRQQVTVGLEVGIQNGTTAILVTGTLIGNNVMTIPPAIYSLIMFATGGAVAVFAGRWIRAAEPNPAKG